MIIQSEFMNDPHGVELAEAFEIECEVVRGEDNHASVNFFNLEEGERMNDHPENNRTFSNFTDFEGKTDAEILEILFNLVPELKNR
jgi:hypothetical protein